MTTDSHKFQCSRKVNFLLYQLNNLLREMSTAGIEPSVFIRKDDPISGKAPIVYVDVFKH